MLPGYLFISVRVLRAGWIGLPLLPPICQQPCQHKQNKKNIYIMKSNWNVSPSLRIGHSITSQEKGGIFSSRFFVQHYTPLAGPVQVIMKMERVWYHRIHS
jgi:hypothetical protein